MHKVLLTKVKNDDHLLGLMARSKQHEETIIEADLKETCKVLEEIKDYVEDYMINLKKPGKKANNPYIDYTYNKFIEPLAYSAARLDLDSLLKDLLLCGTGCRRGFVFDVLIPQLCHQNNKPKIIDVVFRHFTYSKYIKEATYIDKVVVDYLLKVLRPVNVLMLCVRLDFMIHYVLLKCEPWDDVVSPYPYCETREQVERLLPYYDPSMEQNVGLKESLRLKKNEVSLRLFEDPRCQHVTISMVVQQNDEVVDELMYQYLQATPQECRDFVRSRSKMTAFCERLIMDGKIDDGLTEEWMVNHLSRLMHYSVDHELVIMRLLLEKRMVPQGFLLQFCLRAIQRRNIELFKIGLEYLEDPTLPVDENASPNLLIRVAGYVMEWDIVKLLYSYHKVRHTPYLSYQVIRYIEEEQKKWYFIQFILEKLADLPRPVFLPLDVFRYLKPFVTSVVYTAPQPKILLMDVPASVALNELLAHRGY